MVLYYIFCICLEFLYQVGASSANSYPGAGEHKGHFLGISTRRIGRDIYAFVKQKTRETYLDHGGVGAGWLVPVAGEGSCDACLELRCTKDHFQCLVSMNNNMCIT